MASGSAQAPMYQPGYGQQPAWDQQQYAGQQQYAQQYNPQYGAQSYQGYPQAQVEMTGTMDDKQRRKEQKLAEAQARCERVRKQQKIQDKKDSQNLLILMAFSTIGLGSLLGMTIVGPSWGSKEFTGLGVGMVYMRTSLFKLDLHISCDKSLILEQKACEKLVAKHFEGEFDLHAAQGNACSLNPSACDVLSRTYLASFPLFLAIGLAVLSSFAGAFCLFTYSKAEADPALRSWSVVFILATPAIATGGIVAWAILMPDLGEIPTSWTMLVGSLAPGLTHSETRDFQFGWTFFAACLIDFAMMILGMIFICMFKASDDEETVALQKEKDRAFADALEEQRDNRMPDDYGSLDAGKQA